MKPIPHRFRAWHAPTLGTTIGLAYGVIDRLFILESLGAPKPLLKLTELTEFCLPAVLGLVVGMIINHLHHQLRINQSLSTENAKLQQNLLAHTLSAHILHELRNPLHNLTSLLEEVEQRMPPEETSILHESMVRFQDITHQLSRWNVLDERINPKEPTMLPIWLNEFLKDRVLPKLHHRRIALSLHVEPVVLQMHPLLLSQCFVTLFHNAIEAIERGGAASGAIRITARLCADHPGIVEIQMQNTGERYPEAVLSAQGGEPINNPHGMGLGLVLVRQVLEQAGGSLRLSNASDQATTTLRIPGA